MNELDQVNKKKDELEEKIRLLTLASEEKQVKAIVNFIIHQREDHYLKVQNFITKLTILTFSSTLQRTISDLEGKIYNANYNQKYLTENVQDLQTKLEDERYHSCITTFELYILRKFTK